MFAYPKLTQQKKKYKKKDYQILKNFWKFYLVFIYCPNIFLDYNYEPELNYDKKEIKNTSKSSSKEYG